MQALGQIISSIFNAVFTVATLFAFVFLLDAQSLTLFVLFPFVTAIAYFSCYWLLQRAIFRRANITLPLFEPIRQRAINELLELAAEPGFYPTQEIQSRMLRVGLKPLFPPTYLGEQIGTQFDEPIYDFIVTRELLETPLMRYNYLGPASYDADGNINELPHEGVVVYRGQFYELAPPDEQEEFPEPEQASPES